MTIDLATEITDRQRALAQKWSVHIPEIFQDEFNRDIAENGETLARMISAYLIEAHGPAIRIIYRLARWLKLFGG